MLEGLGMDKSYKNFGIWLLIHILISVDLF